jgi:hypothetical protein
MLSCSVKEVSEQELKAYILDQGNGLYKSFSKDEITLEVSYRPAALVWRNELKEIRDEKAQNELRKSFDSLNYFILRFSKRGGEIENSFISNPARFNEIINYLAFGIRQRLFQVQGSDTTLALDVINARTFGSSTGTTVMAVFNGNLKEKNENVKLCFNDILLGIGSTEFEFRISDIKNTPTLILN